jgi:hypothetical protein
VTAKNDHLSGSSKGRTNGRYIACASDESGQFDVYVRQYLTATSEWKVSLAGGTQPEGGRA